MTVSSIQADGVAEIVAEPAECRRSQQGRGEKASSIIRHASALAGCRAARQCFTTRPTASSKELDYLPDLQALASGLLPREATQPGRQTMKV